MRPEGQARRVRVKVEAAEPQPVSTKVLRRAGTPEHQEAAMRDRMTKIDWLLLPVLVLAASGAIYAAFHSLGFLGIGILGLLTGVVAVNVDLEQGWPIGPTRMNLHSARLGVQDRMSRAERAAQRADLARDQIPIFVAKVASAGMIILGFGLFVLVQL